MAGLVATITITLDDAGNVNAEGPMDNRVLFYGLLQVARDIAHERALNKAIHEPVLSDIKDFGRIVS